MKGNIITREKCFMCGLSLKHDERRHRLFCPDHPQVAAVKNFTVRFSREIQEQFRSYDLVAEFLNGLRFKTSEGSFDAKAYQSDKAPESIAMSEKTRATYVNLRSQISEVVLETGMCKTGG